MKKYLEQNDFNNIDFLYNNSYLIENYIIAGTRAWNDDEVIVARELLRLELSIQDGINKFGQEKEIIICLHYPPTKEFIDIMKKYNVKKCFYGHLHGEATKNAIEGNIEGIEFKLVSCDYLQFKLHII